MECAEELLGTYTEMSQYPSACSPLQKNETRDQQLEKSREEIKERGWRGGWGRGHIMQFWVILHCHLYWNATPVPFNGVILYMAFLLNISKEGGGEGRGVMCLLPFFFFPRVKAGNVSSCLVIITDQLLIKIKWSFLNFNTILQIMQKTQLIALLAKITFKNSTTQRAKII